MIKQPVCSPSSPPQSGQVLVVDDHAPARQSMADILTHAGHQVQSCCSAVEALHQLESEEFDVIITDLKMPGMSGIEFIRELQQLQVDAQVVMVTAYASVSTAVQAMRYGAFDYIEKPFDVDQLESLVQRTLQQGQVVGRRSSMPADNRTQAAMLGDSSAMQTLKQRIAQAAPTDVTILITGESGTGKELVAKHIHDQSGRFEHALVSLNCPALSPQLMESELFGHERGAFTSADTPRVGRFELAHQGTILLDEVTEIDLSLQAKLLRVLQEKSFERVGSSETKQIDVRVLASTNRDLQREVAEGRFREDLFFRLAVIPIQVPPLRQRREDIPDLASHFLCCAASRLQRDPVELSGDGLQMLTEYHWPGNVRELENLMTRASVLCQSGPIAADQLRPWLIDSVSHANVGETTDSAASCEPSEAQISAIPVGSSLQEMEQALIEATLEKFDGHRGKTAQALGIGVRTLTNKLRSYGYAPREKSFVNRTMARSA